MQARWEEKTLALTPDTEQERALLDVLAAAHVPTTWTPTPPSVDAVRTFRPQSVRMENGGQE